MDVAVAEETAADDDKFSGFRVQDSEVRVQKTEVRIITPSCVPGLLSRHVFFGGRYELVNFRTFCEMLYPPCHSRLRGNGKEKNGGCHGTLPCPPSQLISL